MEAQSSALGPLKVAQLVGNESAIKQVAFGGRCAARGAL